LLVPLALERPELALIPLNVLPKEEPPQGDSALNIQTTSFAALEISSTNVLEPCCLDQLALAIILLLEDLEFVSLPLHALLREDKASGDSAHSLETIFSAALELDSCTKTQETLLLPLEDVVITRMLQSRESLEMGALFTVLFPF